MATSLGPKPSLFVFFCFVFVFFFFVFLFLFEGFKGHLALNPPYLFFCLFFCCFFSFWLEKARKRVRGRTHPKPPKRTHV